MKIRESVHSVGAVDGGVRLFHGYQTPLGTTYNAYLVLDEKITLIDLVKRPFADELLRNIKAVIGDRPVDNIICNHVEPDHSGALPVIVAAYPEAIVYGTANCEKELCAYYPDASYRFVTVKNGGTLSTGKYTFTFLPMPMVHWPDSMATYLEQEKILFSNDAFGQHIGTGEMYDTDITAAHLIDRAGDYYANIILPFGMQVKKVLEAAANLDISLICPSHGVILSDRIPQVMARYADWCAQKADEKKAVIVFDTMWGTTRKLAQRLHDVCVREGREAELIDLAEKHHSYAMARMLDARYVFVGSPTLNNQMMPTVSAFLTYLRGLKPKNRIGRAFGSYGWSGESIGQVHDVLMACGFEMLEPLKAQWNVE